MHTYLMKRFFIPLILIFIGLIAYFPSFSAKLFWDDDDFITKNVYIKNFQIGKFFTAQAVEGSGKVSNYFRPLQFTTYALIYKLFGPSPLAFHTLSILIHIAASISIYFFFSILFSVFSGNLKANPDAAGISGLAVSLLISLFFLVHPVQTEAVSYVSGFSDPLVALFGFGTLITFLLSNSSQARNLFPQLLGFTRGAQHKEKDIERNKYIWQLISLALFFLTLLSKENGIIFTGIIFLLALYFYIYRQRHFLRFFITVAPFLLLTLGYLLYHTHIIDVIDMKAIYGSHPYTDSVLVRLSTFLSLLPTYISILIFPKTLFYERDFTIKILTTPWSLTSFLVVIAIVGAFAAFIASYRLQDVSHKKNTVKLEACSLKLFLFLAFFVSFLPYTGLVLINGIMYEHFLYIPLVFFFAFFLSILFSFIPKKYVLPSLFLLSTLYFLLIIKSWSRQIEWQDPIRFYQQTLAYAPASFRVRNNLGMSLQEQGNDKAAIGEFQKVIELNPSIPNPYHNMGNIYFRNKEYARAEEFFRKAIAADPYFGYSYTALVELYKITGDDEKLQQISLEITKRFKQ